MNKEFSITKLYMGICVLVFLIMMPFGHSSMLTLIRFGAKTNFQIVDLKLWYLFTPMFLHASLSHLLMNMLALYYLGEFIEHLLGRTRYICFILLTGMFSTIGSFILSNTISLGASGVIFGFFAVHAFLYIEDRARYEHVFGRNIIGLLVLNLITTFLIPNIDIGGHLFGLLSGFCILYFFEPYVRVRPAKKLIALLVLLLILGGGLVKGISYKNSLDYFQMKYYYYSQTNPEKAEEVEQDFQKYLGGS